MLKTERMKKVVVVGAKPQLRPVIETLHRMRALHIEEHRAGEFFTLGTPLPEGEAVAEALLKARGLERSLGMEDEKATYTMEGHEAAFARIREVETAVSDLVDERAALVEDAKRLESEIARLRRLAGLGVRLEHLSGYQNIKAYVGSVTEDPTPRLAGRLPRHELAKARDASGFVIALFVPNADASEAEAVLAEVGYHAIEVPTGEGPIDTVVGQRTTEARHAHARIEAIDAELARYRAERGAELLAATETLQVAAEKAGAPLRFATSPNAFVVTGFVPLRRQAEVEKALFSATDQRLHVEWSDPAVPGHHGHHTGERHQEHTADPDVGHASTEPTEEPPIKFAHKDQSVNSFTMLLGMHSLPKYKEVDPTILIWITFPIFFGLMVADAAFGILIFLIALYFRNHYVLGIGGPKVSRMLLLSSIWTFLLGVFMFGEAFGIHFVDAAGTLSWEHLFGADWSQYYASAQHSVVSAAEEGAHAAAAAEEHKAPHLAFLGIQLGYFSKLHDVTTLLIVALLIAAVHLNLAILIGIRNMWVLHGVKHAILGRVSWLVLEAGIGLVAYGAIDGWATLTNVGWGVFVLSVLMLLVGEGPIAILELPKIFSNGLSYTRLTAVGLSKAGMILAVNTFAFTMTGDHTATIAGAGGAGIIGSLFLIVIGYAVILGLGILAGGLHSLRLQLVEFFGWFYEGGGRAFKAFGDPHERP